MCHRGFPLPERAGKRPGEADWQVCGERPREGGPIDGASFQLPAEGVQIGGGGRRGGVGMYCMSWHNCVHVGG